MRRKLLLVLTVGVLSVPVTTRAGEVIVGFRDQRAPAPEALAHVKLKAVVTEFLDPGNTGLGLVLASLLWEETLLSISDQAGAGVILVRSEDREGLTEMLATDYHKAAVELAKEQRARMVLWGVIEPIDEKTISAEVYLTLLTRERSGDLRLRWGNLDVGIPRTRFNFAPCELSVKDVVERVVVTKRPTRIRVAPAPQATVSWTAPENTVLRSRRVRGFWMEVVEAGGRTGFLRAPDVHVAPLSVEVPTHGVGRELGLRRGPSMNEPVVKTINPGSYEVTDMRVAANGTWYRLGPSGWAAGWEVRPKRTLPSVHFLAGLYRYYGSKWEDAAREFRTFCTVAGLEETNVNLAAAWQLVGASEVMGKDVGQAPESAYDAFDRAVQQTPNDPAAYLLRGVAGLGVLRDGKRILSDMDHALELDPRGASGQRVIGQYGRFLASAHPDTQRIRANLGLEGSKEEFNRVVERHDLLRRRPQLRIPLNR